MRKAMLIGVGLLVVTWLAAVPSRAGGYVAECDVCHQQFFGGSDADAQAQVARHKREKHAEEPRDLRLTPVNERSPWTGDEAFYRLRGWGANGGRPYQGLVVADCEHAVGSVAWYPLPDGTTAALAWIGLERAYRGLHFGSYLLDSALVEMADQGYRAVEVHVHTKDSPEAFALFRRRGFEVIDYWVNLVKT